MEQYRKEFDAWNEDKKRIHYADKNVWFKAREIWFVSLGVNVGIEIDGKHNGFERPVLVLRKINRKSAIVVPLTSTIKEKDPMFITYDISGVKKSATITQMRFIDSQRLRRKVGMMTEEDFAKVKSAVKQLFE